MRFKNKGIIKKNTQVSKTSNPDPLSTVLAGQASGEDPAGVEVDYLGVFAGGAVLPRGPAYLPSAVGGQG